MAQSFSRGPSLGYNLGQALGTMGANYQGNIAQQRKKAEEASALGQILKEAGENPDPMDVHYKILQSPAISNETKSLHSQFAANQARIQAKQQATAASNFEQGEANKRLVRSIEKQRGLEPGSLGGFEDDPKLAAQITKPTKQALSEKPIDPEQLEKIKAIRAQPDYTNLDEGQLYQRLTEAGVSRENAETESKIRASLLERGKKSSLEEREYKYKRAKKTIDKADSLRESLPELEAAGIGMRDAIESEALDPFTLDAFAEMLGIDALNTAKGGQFKAASKVFFGKSVQEVGGVRPNMYIEQQLAGALAKIGRSKWANLAALEFQDLKVDINRRWLDTYDRIVDENDGEEPADIERMISKEMRPFTENRLEKLQSTLKDIENLEKHDEKRSKGFVRFQNEDGMIVDIPVKEANEFKKNEKWKVVK